MAQSILDNGPKMDIDVEKVFKFGQMVQNTKGIGKMIWLMEKVD